MLDDPMWNAGRRPSNMLLSILVCTVTKRAHSFAPLIDSLSAQIDGKFPDVEIIYFGDNKKRSLAKKRNDMIRCAQGDYVCFVDDDDIVSNDFVAKLRPALLKGPDIVCYTVTCSVNGGPAVPVHFNKDFTCNANKPGLYERMPNHLVPIRRELALMVPYENVRGEDSVYAEKIRPLIKTQEIVTDVLYQYIFNSRTSEAQ